MFRLETAGGEVSFVQVTVEPQDDHFVSTSIPVDEGGNGVTGQVSLAPKFYGVTAEQAFRRMVSALENSYEEVVPLTADN